jgi:hypothetical protein
MTVARVQGSGASANSGTSLATSSITVTAGNLLVIYGYKWTNTTSAAYTAGNCTKTAGTATIGTITLDHSYNTNSGSNGYHALGIWSIPITGSGTITVTIAETSNGGGLMVAWAEYSGVDVSASRVRTTGGGAYSSTNAVAPALSAFAPTAGDLVCVCMMNDCVSATASTAGTNYSLIYSAINSSTGGAEDRVVAATSETAPMNPANNTSTHKPDRWFEIAVVYKMVAGAAMPIPVVMHHRRLREAA